MLNKKTLIIFFLLVFLGWIFFVFYENKKNPPEVISLEENYLSQDIKSVNIGGQNIKVEVVSTENSRKNGLSGREKLKEDEGMLFIFEKSDKYSFWMKEMNFPIDIIWIGEDFRVVDIKKNVSPESFPESFSPKKDAMYVLEISANFSEKNNLKEGNLVEFLPF